MFTTSLDVPTCYFLYYHVKMEVAYGWRRTLVPTVSKMSGDNYRTGDGDEDGYTNFSLACLLSSTHEGSMQQSPGRDDGW